MRLFLSRWRGGGDRGQPRPAPPALVQDLYTQLEWDAPADWEVGEEEAEGETEVEMSEESELLSPAQVSELYCLLPGRCQGRTWSLIFSTARHGFSLAALYRAAATSSGPAIVVIRCSEQVNTTDDTRYLESGNLTNSYFYAVAKWFCFQISLTYVGCIRRIVVRGAPFVTPFLWDRGVLAVLLPDGGAGRVPLDRGEQLHHAGQPDRAAGDTTHNIQNINTSLECMD